ALFIVIFGVVFGRGASVQFDVGVTGPETAFRDQGVTGRRRNPSFVVTQGDEATERQALQAGDRAVVAVFSAPAQADASGLPPVPFHSDVTEGPTAQVAVGAVRQVLIDVAGGPPPLPIAEEPV